MPRRPPSPLLRLAATAVVAVVAALALGACGGDTLQLKPLRDRDLTHAAGVSYVVYWVGRAFDGMPVTFAGPQTGGSVLLDYGNCVVGGQSTCVRALSIVTSHDNSFVPGAQRTGVRRLIRGRLAVIGMGGRTIEIATGSVVVDINAATPALARAVAEAMTPLNRTGAPGAPLPPALPPNGFDVTAS
jgi:hypothetical protein